MTSDEDRWSEARSLLEREPSGPAERRLRRGRRQRVLIVLAVSLVLGVPVGIASYRFTEGSSGASTADVPTWQELAGLTLAGIGIVVLLVGLVAQLRANQGRSAWHSPLFVLTNKQRKELVRAVRGQATVAPDRLPLARHLASAMLQQRVFLTVYSGLTLLWTGQLIAAPSWWRAVLAGSTVVLFAVGVPLVLRQERQARRFLEQHPDPSAA